jgi:translocation and assembly module TamB
MNFRGKPKRYLITFSKVIGWVVLSIFALLIIVALAIQIPFVQNKLVQKAISFLQEKIGTQVSLDHISLSIPKKIVLTGLYLEDQQKDTLLYAGELAVNTDLWKLTKHTIQLNDIELTDFNGSIKRSAQDSSFNFDYILKAFAGDESAPPDTTQTPWKFSIENVALEKINFLLDDALLGNQIALKLGTLDLSMDEFDLDNSILKADRIDISNVVVSIIQSQVKPDTVVIVPDSASEPASFDIGVNEINLDNIQAEYQNTNQGQNAKLDLGHLTLEAENIDLKNRIIGIEKFGLEKTFASYHQMAGYQTKTTTEEPKDSTAAEPQWQITLDEFVLSDNSIQYHNFDKPFQKKSIDFNHLWITKLSTEANDVQLNGPVMKGELNRFSFHERSGFTLESFTTSFSLNENTAEVRDFILDTSNSKIILNASAKFESLKNIKNVYPEAFFKLAVENSFIGLTDVLLLSPTALDSIPLNINPNATVSLDTDVEGYLKNLSIRHFEVKTLKETYLKTQGHIQLRKNEDPYLSMHLEKFHSTKKDIESILPDTLIPASLAIPQWLDISGNLKGTFNSPTVNTLVDSDFGTIKLAGNLTRRDAPGISKYAGTLEVIDFHTGKLLKKEQTMGSLTLKASVEGSGLTMEELNTRLKLHVASFVYQNYNYQDFTLNGSVKKYFFDGVAKLQDKNLNLVLDGDLDYNADVPKYHFTFDLKNADFKALNLSERQLRARGTIDVDLATADFKVINGNVDVRKVAIFNGEDLYAVDSLLFASIDQKGQSEISIRSDIIDGNFKGTINLYSLPDVLRRHFNSYFSLQDTVYNKLVAPQNFKFDLTIKNTDLLTEILVPELDPFVPGEIKGQFDSNSENLDLHIGLAKMGYAGVRADSITFKTTSNKEALTYTLALRKIQKDTMRIEALKLQGNVANDSIRTQLVILDSTQRDKYVLGGIFYSLEKVFQFKFLQDQVILNYAPWTTPSDNSLQFTSKGIQAHNFSITNINEMIALRTSNDQDSSVSVVFKDLNLQNITRLIEGATPLDGLANGDLNMMVADKGAFNSTLRIDDMIILDQPWGNLALALGRTSSGPLNIDLRLESEKTSLKAAGYYAADGAQPEINVVANIEKFDLASIDPIARGQLKNTKGQLNGEVSVTGNPATPDIKGELNFVKASFTPSMINSEFLLENERITIENDKIVLSDFQIRDKQNNLAEIDGEITSNAFQNFNLNLGLNTKNFQILNSTEKDNELFYGNVRLTTQAKIRGPINQPVVDMNIDLSDDSNFTYVVPQSEKGVLEQTGIVEFIDRDAKNDPFLASVNPKDTIKSTFRGIDLSANIEFSEKETFNIIIDPATGDKLTVKGNSTLTLDIDPTGDMILTGRYEIVEGTYDLSFYRLVKRNFSIEKGSTIVWAGNPLDATMDIRASHEVDASPMELMAAQTTDEYTLNQYKQRLPFFVHLLIKGELLAPEISFQLDLAESKRNIFGGALYGKIQDINTRESELNKQVFALLLLKRFISDNPFENRAGSDVASTARRSVSKLLTEQLNRLSQNVKGIELTFDVQSSEDYSSGEAEAQTQVQLGLQKSLLDDRLIVKVSGNFEVEGEASDQNSVSDYIGDLALEYKLTEDGRFRITGFRNTNFDMISGELIETGVGLIYIKDYNTLRELFRANAKDN